MSRNVSYSTVPRAVEQALAQGYQLSPQSVKLLVKLGEQRRIKKLSPEPTFEMIVREVIEAKIKRSMGARTIEIADLVELFPDLFEFEQVEVTPVPSITTSASSTVPVSAPKDVPIQSEFEIIKDPSLAIRPTGIEGFPALFKSRYEKSVEDPFGTPRGSLAYEGFENQQGEGELQGGGPRVFEKTHEKRNRVHSR